MPEEDPLRLGYQHLADVLIDSITVDQASVCLGVSSNTVRVRVKSRKLYAVGMKYGLCRLPRFQFEEKGLVPGFAEVAPFIPTEMSVTAVENWFTLSNPDLYVDDDIERTRSPIVWLSERREALAVIMLLRLLDSAD